MDTAAQGLVHHGFRIEKVSGGLEADGPQMKSNRENPMRGSGHIVVRAESGRLTVEADLAGLKTLVAFALLFPPILAAGLMIGLGGRWLAGLAMVAIWLVIGPLIARGMRNATRRELDTWVDNIAELSRRR